MLKIRRLYAAAITGAMLFSTQAQAQAAADSIADVVITGKRSTGIFAPNSATCVDNALSDPFFVQQMIASGGDPLMGPTIYQPTRFPRNPDYTAPPLSPPGSALPDTSTKWSRGPSQTTVSRNATMDPTMQIAGAAPSVFTQGDPSEDAEASVAILASSLDATSEAIAVCRGIYASQSGEPASFTAGRDHIALRDKTLPTGFALFDHGRYAEALEYFEKAYNKLPDEYGGDEASLMIGKIYLQGLGEKSDPKKAIFWLERAAGAKFNPTKDMPIFDPKEPDKNTAIGEAAIILANIYKTGFGGVKKDPAKVRKWLARAEYVGHISAGKQLADMYFYGKDAPRDLKLAVSLYKKAATYDYPPAQVALADIYYRGTDGIPKNLKTAMGWYKQAARYQHPDALYALAVAYDSGEGEQADPQKAIVFYKAAALAGKADAQAALGSYFYEGGSVLAKDDVLARKWFEHAAIGGNSEAMFNLGVMMMKGEGGPTDQPKAWAWFKLAQAGGSQKAAPALAALEARMTPAERQSGLEFLGPKRQG